MQLGVFINKLSAQEQKNVLNVTVASVMEKPRIKFNKGLLTIYKTVNSFHVKRIKWDGDTCARQSRKLKYHRLSIPVLQN